MHKTYKLQSGDYVKKQNENDFETVEYIDEVVQAASMALKTQRGRFYPNKNFGSYIKTAINKDNNAALVYARQATEHIDGVYVKNAEVKNNGLFADLIINDVERSVRIDFETDL